MTDLQLIDELLCIMKQRRDLSWEQMERDSWVTRDAMHRLRKAWRSGEMPVITLGLANYFDFDRIRG